MLLRRFIAGSFAFPALLLAAVPSIPIEAFFSRPEIEAPQLSPDGRKLAFLGLRNGALNLVVLDLEQARLSTLTDFVDYDVAEFAWLNEKRLVFAPGEDGWHLGGVYAVDADGRRRRQLVESLAAQARQLRASWSAGRIGVVPRTPGDHVLLEIAHTGRNLALGDVYRVHTVTGARSLALRNPGHLVAWWADNRGQIRLTAAYGAGSVHLNHRPDESAAFERVATLNPAEENTGIVGFDEDDVHVWCLTDRERETIAIRRLNTTTGVLSEVLHGHERYDVRDLMIDRWGGRMRGWHVDTDRFEAHLLDSSDSRLIAQVGRAFPGLVAGIVARSADGRVRVIEVWSDREPGRFFIHESGRQGLEMMGIRRPGISPDQMVAMEPIRFVARDGLEIEGYVFRPTRGNSGPAPMVVIPHGGPLARDVWGFNSEAQFLANRGYAVLKINFRGSSGYGRTFALAGRRQWGLAMQDDITDGAQWSIDQGIADPSRIAIYGASYGGFAALAGMAFTPDLYRCGLSMAGVTDVGLILATLSREEAFLRDYIADLVGDPKTEQDYIRRVSPVYHVDKIKGPLLLAWGRQDDRVDFKHANRFVTELKKHRKPHELIVKADEGHGFRKQSSVIEFYSRMEAFLAEHLQ